MPDSDGEAFAAGGAIGDALALGAGVSIADGVHHKILKKLYWTSGEAGAPQADLPERQNSDTAPTIIRPRIPPPGCGLFPT